jgi:hypothetical protein
MPTISEPKWPDTSERIAQAVNDFIEAKPVTVSDSEHVLSARLFGFGLRGQDLRLEVNRAVSAKLKQKREQQALQQGKGRI